MPYCFVTCGQTDVCLFQSTFPGAKAYEKAEDPIYALENNLPIDVQHYLDHQLAQPLMRIFEPVCKDVKAELLSGEHPCPGAATVQSSVSVLTDLLLAAYAWSCRVRDVARMA
eukprot:GHUV01033960.1.p2 GENE.GHUV01033960.1~~GHUV01033960.1.p2  ORF type:complete len:113 (+),score=19.68 GHUV01033960.1:113-451(+)